MNNTHPANALNKLINKSDVINRFDTTLVYAPDMKQIKFDNSSTPATQMFYFTDNDDRVLPARFREAFGNMASIRLVPDIRSVLKKPQ